MTTPTDAELMKAAVQHSHELYKLPTSRAAFQAGVLFASQTLAKWGQPQAVAGGEPVDRVFIVATGEEHEGEATYTRYDHAPPPLCDSECLYAAPPPQAVREPFTPAQQERMYRNRPNNVGKSASLAEWRRTIEYIERAHDIAKGDQHG